MGMMMLPMPWATSSRVEFRGSPFIRPAAAPHKRLSIMPSAAMEMAGAIRLGRVEISMPLSSRLSAVMSFWGITPTSATAELSATGFSTKFSTTATMMATREPGRYLVSFLGHRIITAMASTANITACILGAKPSRP